MEYTNIILECVISYGLVLLLVHGGDKILEGMEDVGLADEDFKMGGSKHAGSGDVFRGTGTGSSYLYFGDVGYYPPHETGPGRVNE